MSLGVISLANETFLPRCKAETNRLKRFALRPALKNQLHFDLWFSYLRIITNDFLNTLRFQGTSECLRLVT